MKLAIMQPYFFPYLGYFSLIKATDQFVLLDTVQFIRHGWIERNRILKPGEGWQYIGVPLQKHGRETLIRDIAIRNAEDWRDRIVRQLEHYRKTAPHYAATLEVVRESLSVQSDSIVDVNASALAVVCRYLGIELSLDVFSKMGLQIEPVTHAGEWALNIAKAMGAEAYVNPPGGQAIFDKSQFDDAGIQLQFLANTLRPYTQRRPVFEAGLSIIDAMMFNDVAAVNELIAATELVGWSPTGSTESEIIA